MSDGTEQKTYLSPAALDLAKAIADKFPDLELDPKDISEDEHCIFEYLVEREKEAEKRGYQKAVEQLAKAGAQ